MPDDGLREYEQSIPNTNEAHIRDDGKPYEVDYLDKATSNLKVLQYDPLEFYTLVDIFASQYGLGGCRSLHEYAEMIDQTDPALLEGLKYAIYIRNSDGSEGSGSREASTSGTRRRGTQSNTWGQDTDMGDFLANSGIPQSKIREARGKIDSGKITKEERDKFHKWLYNNVTPEKLRDPNFDLKKAHARIKEYVDRCGFV